MKKKISFPTTPIFVSILVALTQFYFVQKFISFPVACFVLCLGIFRFFCLLLIIGNAKLEYYEN